MRRTVVFLIAFLSITLIAGVAHKYYVAVFQVEYVAQKKELQVTSRIFIDDLEKELNKKYSKKFYLGSERELPAVNDYLQTYFTEKIKFTLNGKTRTIKYLGKEIEDDVIICYFTVPAPEAVKSVSVRNTTLFESFPDQQNYIHIKINSNKKSLLLTNDEQQGTLEF